MKKTLKSITLLVLTLLVAAIAVLPLAACTQSADFTVGIIQLAPHVALDKATQGFIDGLTEEMNKAGKTVMLTQTGSYFAALGRMTIAKDGTVTTKLLHGEDLKDLEADADVKAIEDAWMTKIDNQLGEKIGSISDEAVFYLMSRGMSEEDARALIVSGFADNVSKELPLEYAVEMNNLIRLEMKGSIG